MSKDLTNQFRKWLLVKYRDSKGRLSINGPEAKPFLIFMPEGRLTGSGGCNRFFSSYEVSDCQLKIGLIGSTRMYCHDPPWLMDLEGDFFGCLERSSSFELTEDALTIKDREGKELLSFMKDENWP
jgi:heat shock protein HslJ